MAAKTQGYQQQKRFSSLLVNLSLTIICIIWLLPIIGLLITSFRYSQDILSTGWWTVFPHREYVNTRQIILDPSVNVDGDFQVEGITSNFTDLRNGVTLPNGEKLTWYGNKRTRTIDVAERKWIGFSTKMTLENYSAVIGGKTVTFKDATGRDVETRGPNLGGAFLNSLAVTIPATIIPILDRRICRLRLRLAELPWAEDIFHRRGSDAGSAAANRPGTDPAGLYQVAPEWNLSGDLAGPYRIWPSTGHLPVVQLYGHTAA